MELRYYNWLGILLMTCFLSWTEAICQANWIFARSCQNCFDVRDCIRNNVCSEGCHEGWRPPVCNISYPLLRDPPTKISQSATEVTISWKKWKQNSDYGNGDPKAYIVQSKKIPWEVWTPVGIPIPADEWSEHNDGFQTTISLTSGQQYSFRVLVEDASGISRESCAAELNIYPEQVIHNIASNQEASCTDGENCHEGCSRCSNQLVGGICIDGCIPGWKTPYCNVSYPVLWNAPSLVAKTAEEVTISWKKWSRTRDVGDGHPSHYQIQAKAISQSQWQTVKNNISEDDATNETFLTTFHLNLETEQEVRVLIVDTDGVVREDCIPTLHLNATITYKTYNQLFKDAGVWIGCLAAGGFLVAVGIVVCIECRQRRKSNMVRAQESRLDLINNGTLSNTLRRNGEIGDTGSIRSAHVRTLAAEPQRNLRVSDRLSAFFQSGGRSWFPLGHNADERSQRESTGSWYTEWYGSRKLYDNPVIYQCDDNDEISIGRSGSVDSAAMGPTYVNAIQKTFHNNLKPV